MAFTLTLEPELRDMMPMSIDLRPLPMMTDEEFFLFCQANRDLRIERTASGEIIMMAPVGGETGRRNANLVTDLTIWARANKQGVVFDSSTGFDLPSGAMRSPDAAWVRRDRLAQLTADQKRKFLPLCPDFIIELRSSSDVLRTAQDKMGEWIANGVQLGWLIDPTERNVYIYRPDYAVEQLQNQMTISGEPVLPGFVLELSTIWHAGF
ncbi:MAG: Uma2 family endonuclease [Chloroflexi bacterium]|nr:Uma2 family endonuclease [Chloroflexota bacterium]